MSDWSIVQDVPIKESSSSSKTPSDWSIVEQPSASVPFQENISESIVKAPFRVGEDLLKGSVNFAKKLPLYAEAAKTEIPGVFQALRQNPSHALGQGVAGLAEQGHKLFNTPHDLINYATNRLNLIPRGINEKVQMGRMPSDTQEMINQTFGRPQQPGEALIRGVTGNSLTGLGVGKAASVFNPANLLYKNIAKDVISTAEKNKKSYSNKYNNLWKEAENKGYSDLKHIAPNIDVKTLRKYSPEKSIVGIDDFIKNPNAKTAHNAKSDLLKIERELKKKTTLNTAERKQYKAVRDAIDNIQGNMFKGKNGKVNESLMNKYNKIQKGYSNEVVPYKHKAINEFLRNERSEKELVNALSRGSFASKRGKHHKAIGYRNMLNEHPYITGAFGGAGGLALYNELMGNKVPEQ